MTFKLIGRLAVALLVPSALASAQGPSSDWPQWRGPNRDGVIPSFTAPARWPDQLTMRWRVDVGTGHSTPILVGSRVYMFSRRGDDEVVAAFEAATGIEIWRASYPAPYEVVSVAEGHGKGPKSTPVFFNGRIFTLGISGILSAFDAGTGARLWQKPAPPVGPLYTTSQSPLIDRGLLIVHVGGTDNGALSAFDPETGRTIWQWTGDGPGYGSPIIADVGGTRQVITFTQDNLVGVSAETGELLWLRPFKTARLVQALTPVVYRDTVIVSAFESGITAFRIVKRDNRWVTENAWKNDDIYSRFSNGVVVGDAFFSLSGQNFGWFYFVDARTGAALWKGAARTGENAAIARAGDVLFALKDNGELLVGSGASPTAGFMPIKSYKVSNGDTWAAPSIAGNRIFVKDLTTLTLWTID